MPLSREQKKNHIGFLWKNNDIFDQRLVKWVSFLKKALHQLLKDKLQISKIHSSLF